MSHAQVVAWPWAAPWLRREVGTATIAEPMGGPRLGGKHRSLRGGQPQVRLLARGPLAWSPCMPRRLPTRPTAHSACSPGRTRLGPPLIPERRASRSSAVGMAAGVAAGT